MDHTQPTHGTPLEAALTDFKVSELIEIFELIYDGSLDGDTLELAVSDKAIPPKSPDAWQCNGIRKLLSGKLDLAKHSEVASSISHRISRLQVERPERFDDLTAAEQSLIGLLHGLTGSRKWEREEGLGEKLQSNKELIRGWGMDFSKTPSSQLDQKLTSKSFVKFKWTECGHAEERRAMALNTSINTAKMPSCATCRRIDGSFITWYEENRPFLEGSGLDISAMTEDDLMDSAYAKREFIVSYSCGDSEKTTFQSLKAKHKRAVEMGQEYIACNGCKVSEGTFEMAIRALLKFARNYNPGLEVEKQARIVGIEIMPYDIRITTASGIVYYIEIDGGFHYKGHSSADEVQFTRKVEVDRIKTETVLRQGDRMIRIDERGHRGEIPELLETILLGAIAGTLPRYTVYGEECPGAQSVAAELKGWA